MNYLKCHLNAIYLISSLRKQSCILRGHCTSIMIIFTKFKMAYIFFFNVMFFVVFLFCCLVLFIYLFIYLFFIYFFIFYFLFFLNYFIIFFFKLLIFLKVRIAVRNPTTERWRLGSHKSV
jgi:hypothetical protein